MSKDNINEIYQTLSRLREKYPDADDIRSIDLSQDRVRKILKEKELSENEVIREFIEICRKEILSAKKKLASDRTLIGDEKAQRELWFIIECREWFLKLVSKDYDSELNTIEAELQFELDR